MDRDNRSHHVDEKEQIFEYKERDLEYAREKGYAEGVRDERRRAVRERKKQRKQKIERILSFLFFIVVTFIVKLLYTFIVQYIEFVDPGWFVAWILFLAGTIFKACTGDRELLKDTRGNMSAWRSVLSGIGEFWGNIRKNNLMFSLFILCTVCLLGGILGKFEVLERTVLATTEFGNAWISYEYKSLKESSNDEESGQQSIDENVTSQNDHSDGSNCKTEANQMTELSELSEAVVQGDKSLGNEGITFIEKSDYSVDDLSKIEISADEYKKILYLSSEEYDIVFLAGEKYAVEDWENQEEINDMVLQMVKDNRAKRKTNLFDNGLAPQYVQDEIDKASADEKNVRSFMEIERIQQVRDEVYDDYPKKGIANLISNSEQLKALVLYYYSAQQQTILYHYGKSILWDGEYLSYADVLDGEVSKRLSKMARRYEDIAFACKDCTESLKAKKLQTAYENAAEWYRGVMNEKDR